jgi:hypothetical protein
MVRAQYSEQLNNLGSNPDIRKTFFFFFVFRYNQTGSEANPFSSPVRTGDGFFYLEAAGL